MVEPLARELLFTGLLRLDAHRWPIRSGYRATCDVPNIAEGSDAEFTLLDRELLEVGDEAPVRVRVYYPPNWRNVRATDGIPVREGGRNVGELRGLTPE